MAAMVPASSAAARARLSDRIVVMKSIAGFSTGVTPSAVKRRLGHASQTIRVGGKIAELTYNDYGLSFDFDTLQRSDPADLVGAIGDAFVSNPPGDRYRTSKGIHVGSTEKAVKRAYHGLTCHLGICDLYQGTPGADGSMDTAFTFFDGKVDSIQIQRVYE